MTSEVKDGSGESQIEASSRESKEELEEARQGKDRSAGQTKEGEQDITFFKFTTTTEGPRRRSGFEYNIYIHPLRPRKFISSIPLVV